MGKITIEIIIRIAEIVTNVLVLLKDTFKEGEKK
jgi:hypothetical protein